MLASLWFVCCFFSSFFVCIVFSSMLLFSIRFGFSMMFWCMCSCIQNTFATKFTLDEQHWLCIYIYITKMHRVLLQIWCTSIYFSCFVLVFRHGIQSIWELGSDEIVNDSESKKEHKSIQSNNKKIDEREDKRESKQANKFVGMQFMVCVF